MHQPRGRQLSQTLLKEKRHLLLLIPDLHQVMRGLRQPAQVRLKVRLQLKQDHQGATNRGLLQGGTQNQTLQVPEIAKQKENREEDNLKLYYRDFLFSSIGN